MNQSKTRERKLRKSGIEPAQKKRAEIAMAARDAKRAKQPHVVHLDGFTVTVKDEDNIVLDWPSGRRTWHTSPLRLIEALFDGYLHAHTIEGLKAADPVRRMREICEDAKSSCLSMARMLMEK